MAILGGLYLLNLTLIAANGRLSAPSDLNLWTTWEQATREEKMYTGWKMQKRKGREGGETENLTSPLVSVLSLWARGFNWGLARSNVHYSALQSIHFLGLIHYDVSLTYWQGLLCHWRVSQIWRKRSGEYEEKGSLSNDEQHMTGLWDRYRKKVWQTFLL